MQFCVRPRLNRWRLRFDWLWRRRKLRSAHAISPLVTEIDGRLKSLILNTVLF
jgi:hypothetical protein